MSPKSLEATASGVRNSKGRRTTGAVQPRGKVGRNAAESQDFLGDLGRQVLPLLAQNDLTAVEKLLDYSTKGKVTKVFYHSIMHACQKQASSSKTVLWLADLMEKQGLQANVVTYNCMLGSCLKELDIGGARDLWEKMLARGLEPNRITYNIMIGGAAKSNDPKAAEAWLNCMIRAGIKPCTVSYTAVIDASAKLGQTDIAEKWFARMVESGETADVVAYNSVINSCAKAGQLDKAEHWVQRMMEADIRPDEKTYNCLMHACAKTKDHKMQCHCYGKLASKSFPPDVTTFSNLIDACSKSGKVGLAGCWLKEMEYHGLESTLACYNCILHACSVQGDLKMAMHYWTALSLQGISPNTLSYNYMIGTFLETGEPQLALQWVLRMLKAGMKLDSTTQAMLNSEEPNYHYAAAQPSIGASLGKLLQVGDFDKITACIKTMQHLGLTLPEDLIEEIIDVCLATPSSTATSRISTASGAFSSIATAEFSESASEAVTDKSDLSELAPAGNLMQSLLPNMTVTWHDGDIVIDF